MTKCWKCNEVNPTSSNYCGNCGMPQTPKMAAQRFWRDFEDLGNGIRGIIQLVGMKGNPELTAKGLAEDVEVPEETWEERFTPIPMTWLNNLIFRIWLDYYDLTVDDIFEIAEKHGIELEQNEEKVPLNSNTLPEPVNSNCPCGNSLPSNPPVIIAQWNEGTQSTAVCFDCFGEINNQTALPE